MNKSFIQIHNNASGEACGYGSIKAGVDNSFNLGAICGL